jgi:hypothetical protein
MEKNKLYSICNNIGAAIWVIVIFLGFLGNATKQALIIYITAYCLIVLGIYQIALCLYFKKSSLLKGISPTSKIAIVGTYVISALLFYFAYYLLTNY